MKKSILALFLCSMLANLMAQAPNGFNYQAAIRNNAGLPLASTNVNLRFTIRNASISGTILYQETQLKTTTALGLVNCVIGSGTLELGAYPTANQWKSGLKFLQVEVDVTGGSTFVDLGTTQIESVPYANYSNASALADSAIKANSAVTATSANTAANFTGKINTSQINSASATTGQVLKWNGSQWAPDNDVGGGNGDNWGTQAVVVDTTLSGTGISGNALKLAQHGATAGQFLQWSGTSWMPASSGGWNTNGTNIYNPNSGNVGVGTNPPLYKLDVTGNTRITGNLGIGVAPSNSYSLYTQQTTKDNVLYHEQTSGFYGSKIVLKHLAGAGDYLEIGRFGSSVSGNYADGTPIGNASTLLAGSAAKNLVVGTLSNNPLQLMTAGNTRLQFDKDGNMYTGLGTSAGSKIEVTKGSKTYVLPNKDTLVSGVYIKVDTTVGKSLATGIYSFSSSKYVSVGGYFEVGRKSTNASNYALAGYSNSEQTGTGTGNYGAYSNASGAESNYGVFGVASGTRPSTTIVGGYFSANGNSNGSTTAYGVYAKSTAASTAYAAYFSGNVFVTGSVSKTGGTFMIDHPQDPANKYLIHSFVESPDMMNVYNGNITTDANGFATVQLPAYFEAENVNFKYQLTVMGQFAQVIVKEKIADNKFVIQTDKPNVEVSWQVTGVRNDVWAQAHPIVPELEKTGSAKGKYILPELYGQPASKAIFPDPGLNSEGKLKVHQ